MISKVVAADSFYHTCRYITNKSGSEVLEVEGVRGHSYKLMAADFENQHLLRPDKVAACFHGILSFYPGEKPTDKMMTEIAGKYLEQLGIVNTQYAISKHTDKAHLHLHIVANMVNYDGRSIRDSFIGLRGKKIAQRLTQEYKLIPALEKNLKLTHLENLSDTEASKYKVYMAISEALPVCRNMQELESRLLKQGIETQYKYKGHTNEKQGISFKIGDFCFKGSKVDRKFSFAGLQKTLSQQQNNVHDQKIDINEITESDVKSENKQLLFNKIVKLKRKGSKTESKDEDMLGEKLGGELLNGTGKMLENLLKHENAGEDLPYEYTEEALKRKRRKPRHKL
jgi:hypothetical protein